MHANFEESGARAARARALKNRNGVTILASAPPGASATGEGGTAIAQVRGTYGADVSRPFFAFPTIHRMVGIAPRPSANLLRDISQYVCTL